MSPRMLNSASRTRSEVGRVARPRGAWRVRPPYLPAMTRTGRGWHVVRARGCSIRLGADRRARLGTEPLGERVAEQRVLGLGELGVGRVDRLGAHPRALLQLTVAGQLGDAELGEAALAHPDELALTAQLEVDLGKREAIAVLGERTQPRRTLGPEHQAQRAVLAATDPPAELMQLGDPVALGVLDEHHGRVGDI